MCRAPVYWSGFHKVRDEWNEEAWENKCAEVFGQALDDSFEEAQAFAENFPRRWQRRILAEVIDDFLDIEKTYRYMKWHDAHPDDMADVFYYGDYYSDRRVGQVEWDDEPVCEPILTKTVGGRPPHQKRVRARQDRFWTMSFYVLV